jgi:hypothetical protein
VAQCAAVDLPAGGDLPVSRVRNADEFLLRFRKIRDDYERLFGPRTAEIRKKYTESPIEKLVDGSLEAHSRTYIVNALLAALNWRLDTSPEYGLPNLVPEAPVSSLEKGTIRFLDYLGLERETNSPLLIVETKRPSSPLPELARLSDSPLSPSRAEVVSRGLAGEPLVREWSGWLTTLKDYVRSVHAKANRPPRRVVLTNGDWLILFLDPSDAFLDGGTRDAGRILVFLDRSDIEQRHAELFRHMEHGIVVDETPGLTPGELPFHVADDAVDRLMHGLCLLYIEQDGIYQPSPVIKVAPVIFLRSRYGAWLRVEAPSMEYELPHRDDRLLAHLAEVREAATKLLCQVNKGLRTSCEIWRFESHLCCRTCAFEEGLYQSGSISAVRLHFHLTPHIPRATSTLAQRHRAKMALGVRAAQHGMAG